MRRVAAGGQSSATSSPSQDSSTSVPSASSLRGSWQPTWRCRCLGTCSREPLSSSPSLAPTTPRSSSSSHDRSGYTPVPAGDLRWRWCAPFGLCGLRSAGGLPPVSCDRRWRVGATLSTLPPIWRAGTLRCSWPASWTLPTPSTTAWFASLRGRRVRPDLGLGHRPPRSAPRPRCARRTRRSEAARQCRSLREGPLMGNETSRTDSPRSHRTAGLPRPTPVG